MIFVYVVKHYSQQSYGIKFQNFEKWIFGEFFSDFFRGFLEVKMKKNHKKFNFHNFVNSCRNFVKIAIFYKMKKTESRYLHFWRSWYVWRFGVWRPSWIDSERTAWPILTKFTFLCLFCTHLPNEWQKWQQKWQT